MMRPRICFLELEEQKLLSLIIRIFLNRQISVSGVREVSTPKRHTQANCDYCHNYWTRVYLFENSRTRSARSISKTAASLISVEIDGIRSPFSILITAAQLSPESSAILFFEMPFASLIAAIFAHSFLALSSYSLISRSFINSKL